MKMNRLFFIGWFLFPLFFSPVAGAGWECQDDAVSFIHEPSDYYGPGEYLTRCPESGIRIRCHHYHRHWVCEKGDAYYWDRNLESAARTACDCPLPEGVLPSSPAVSKKPKKRFHDVPAHEGAAESIRIGDRLNTE